MHKFHFYAAALLSFKHDEATKRRHDEATATTQRRALGHSVRSAEDVVSSCRRVEKIWRSRIPFFVVFVHK